MFLSADSIDDLLRGVLKKLVDAPAVSTSRGSCRERIGVLVELKNPRARLSRSELRGKAISPLGELLWYLAGSDSVDFIAYYAKRYAEEAEPDGTIRGAYGPRLFSSSGINQVENAILALKEKATTRRCVIQIFDAADLKKHYKEVPCTCTLQFFIRKDRLSLLVNMRSNDAYYGLVHDVFAFTMLQELLARKLQVELGIYKHFVGSLHLYDKHENDAKRYIDEDWQDNISMPAMPQGDPERIVKKLLVIERILRTKGSVSESIVASLPTYWRDICRVLQIFALAKTATDLRERTVSEKRKFLAEFRRIRSHIASSFYLPYVDRNPAIQRLVDDRKMQQQELLL